MHSKNRISTVLTLTVFFTLFIALFAAPLKAGNIGSELTLAQVGQAGGRISGLAVDGGEAYLGVGPRMVVLEVGNPSRIRQIGQTDMLPDFVEDIVTNHVFTWVALGESGIRVFEAGPWPVEFGVIDAMPAYGLDAADDYLWVAAGEVGVVVFDITSDPANPELVAVYNPPGIDARKVDFAEGYAFVVDRNEGLRVLEMSYPGTIQQVGSFSDFSFAYVDVAVGDDTVLPGELESGRDLGRG